MDPIESLSEDPISRLGPLPLHRVPHTATVKDAVSLMQSSRSGCVVVCDNGDSPVGIITERDILRHMGTHGKLEVPVTKVASPTVWTVPVSDSVGEALRKMNSHQCRHLTVVDAAGKAIGILSVKLIVRSLVELFPSSVYNLPPTANQVQRDREGA